MSGHKKVLVAVASKYGATDEIADRIAATLSDRGYEVSKRRVEDADSPSEFDAVVLGSGVYAGHWLKQAAGFVEANRDVLAARPVWLFSSGPIGDPPMPKEDPADGGRLMELMGARGHKVLRGKLDRRRLSLPEKAIVMALRVKEGDFRDWEAARDWAKEIADELEAA
jgi:menaquinone-dependent protoporphyrinogen oxidase